MSRLALKLARGALAAPAPSGPAAQPPGAMELVPEWAARSPLFFTAGDDKRDFITDTIAAGTMVGATLAPDGKTRCLTVSNSSGSGNQLYWNTNPPTIRPGFTEIFIGRRLGNSGGAYDQILGTGNLNRGVAGHGFLMNPADGNKTYWVLFDGTNESGSGNGRAGSTTDLEVTIAVFPAYPADASASVTARLYQGGVLTSTRVLGPGFNRSYTPYATTIGSRGGGSGAPYQVAGYGFFQTEFTDAEVASWSSDCWSKFRARA